MWQALLLGEDIGCESGLGISVRPWKASIRDERTVHRSEGEIWGHCVSDESYPRHHSVEEKGRTWIRLFSRSVHLAARGMRAKAGGRRLTKVFLCRITSFAAVVLGQLGPDTHEVCVTADGPDGGGQQAKEPEEQHRSAVVSRVQGWRCCT